ncbi:MAG: alpha/beta hydrolase [Gemmatimonadaceae bacterium]|nr:alpha/beta hydrolase [Gemmatimonadaceae bacterium]
MTNESASNGESVDVSWPLGATTVEATILRPQGDAPFPGVVFVAGSGPTDRSWNSPLLPGTKGSARLLAEVFASTGIASLRYDKRASGPRARENMAHLVGQVSFQSHLEELSGAIRTLASQPYVHPDRLFAVANSEGTLHAMNYQLQHPDLPLAGLVLIAPPGRSVGALAHTQLAAVLAAVPDGETILSLYDAAICRYVAGEPVDPDPSLPPGILGLLTGLTAPANLPFARELWASDGSALLQEVDIPVRVVIGQKDLQVDWRADGDALQRTVVRRRDVTFQFPEHANHVLKHEARPRSELRGAEVGATYNADDAVLDDELVTGILGWLAEHGAH